MIDLKIDGICNTCSHSDTCHYQKEGKEVRIFCEEFEVTGLNGSGIIKEQSNETDRSKPTVGGLCSTCDHHNNCVLISANTIILNCEHYQ